MHRAANFKTLRDGQRVASWVEEEDTNFVIFGAPSPWTDLNPL